MEKRTRIGYPMYSEFLGGEEEEVKRLVLYS